MPGGIVLPNCVYLLGAVKAVYLYLSHMMSGLMRSLDISPEPQKL